MEYGVQFKITTQLEYDHFLYSRFVLFVNYRQEADLDSVTLDFSNPTRPAGVTECYVEVRSAPGSRVTPSNACRDLIEALHPGTTVKPDVRFSAISECCFLHKVSEAVGVKILGRPVSSIFYSVLGRCIKRRRLFRHNALLTILR